jgi:ABC-type transporter Mla MlaB component
MTELSVRVFRSDGVVSLSLFGSLRRSTMFSLRRILREYRTERVRLDLSNCIHLDLDGLTVLAVAQRVARVRGGNLTLARVPPFIEDQVRRAHLDRLLESD